MTSTAKVQQLHQRITDAAALSANTQWRAMLDLTTRMAGRDEQSDTRGRGVVVGFRGVAVFDPLSRDSLPCGECRGRLSEDTAHDLIL